MQEQIQAPCPVWNAASPQDLHNYHTQTGLLLSAIDVPHEVLRCTNPNCNDEAHRTLLSNLYNDIIKSFVRKTLTRQSLLRLTTHLLSILFFAGMT